MRTEYTFEWEWNPERKWGRPTRTWTKLGDMRKDKNWKKLCQRKTRRRIIRIRIEETILHEQV